MGKQNAFNIILKIVNSPLECLIDILITLFQLCNDKATMCKPCIFIHRKRTLA